MGRAGEGTAVAVGSSLLDFLRSHCAVAKLAVAEIALLHTSAALDHVMAGAVAAAAVLVAEEAEKYSLA